MKCLKADNLKGSITVEAAIVLPIFMFFILSLAYIMGLYRVESIVGSSLTESSLRSAMNSYVIEGVAGQGAGKVAESMVGTVSIRSILADKGGKNYLDNSGIKNGLSGIICYTDSFSNPDRVKATANYTYEVPFNALGLKSFFVSQCAQSRKWTGYNILEEQSDEELVYVTNSGTVYHRSPNCTHIKLDIKEVSREMVKSQRNDSGGKYYPCEICGKRNSGQENVYITGSGSCYHTSLNCGGIKRSVKAIPKSKAVGLGACQRCGGK